MSTPNVPEPLDRGPLPAAPPSPGPSSAPRLRAGDEDRERIAEQLREHYVAGRLDVEEFTHRLDAAYRARHLDELSGLLEDLPGAPAEAGTRAAPRGRGAAVGRPRPPVPVIALALAVFVAVSVAVGYPALWLAWPMVLWLGLARFAARRMGGPPRRW